MKILFYVLFVALNYWSLFYMTKLYSTKKLFAIYGVSFVLNIILLFVLTVIVGIFIKFFHWQSFTNVYKQNYMLSIFFSVAIIIMIGAANQVFSFMVDGAINFHQTKNAINIHRNPVKFVIDHQQQIKKVATIIWFLGSFIVLYGACFGIK